MAAYSAGADPVRIAVARCAADSRLQQALRFLDGDAERTLQEQREISEVPSAPFGEEKRGDEYLRRLQAAGLGQVGRDAEGNVTGLLRGSGGGPLIVAAAHLDTVFPLDTDFHVRREGGRLCGPGIADDTRGLAELLSVIRAFAAAGVRPVGDILFCGNVGEEGIGNLRGIRALFREREDIAGFVSLDGFNGAGNITAAAIGSHRYRFTFTGPGGHSLYNFGTPSAVHAMGRAVAAIADLRPQAEPLTTFTVGQAGGGTSVNAIAAQASILVDIRCESPDYLREFEAQVLRCAEDAVQAENRRWGDTRIAVRVELIGDRPAGAQPVDAVIVRAAGEATRALGVEPVLLPPGSTDSNIPISLGVPAVTLDCGGRGYGTHTTGEWYDSEGSSMGPKRAFLLLAALAGVAGCSEPLLARREHTGKVGDAHET